MKFTIKKPLIYYQIALLVSIGVNAYFLFRDNGTDNNYNNELIRKIEDSKNKEIDSLKRINQSKELQNIAILNRFDSLESVKQSIKIIYVEKARQIDNSSVNDHVIELNGIFSGKPQ